MKINIISTNNGVGLWQDYLILKSILEVKHEVNFIDYRKPIHTKADISIHLEHAVASLLPTAPINILIPNPEWYESQWINLLQRFNSIWCKTHETERIFSKYVKDKCIYTSFTSIDKYNPEILKDKTFLHNRGKSSHKGTLATIQAWNKDLGKLIINSDGSVNLPHKEGILTNNKRLSDHDMNVLMNGCLFHICCSEAEGFGHYINEAKSTGAIIITTNGAPMNEMVNSSFGRLIPIIRRGSYQLGITNYIDYLSLHHSMKELLQLSEKELSLMSEKSRQSFLDNDKYFKQILSELL